MARLSTARQLTRFLARWTMLLNLLKRGFSMPGVQYVDQGDKRILLIDFSSVSDYKILPDLVAEAIRLVHMAESPGSARTLVDLSNTRMNGQVISALKSLSRNNGRYAKATAFAGLSKTWSFVLSTLLRSRGKRSHKVIRSRSDALLWLEKQ